MTFRRILNISFISLTCVAVLSRFGIAADDYVVPGQSFLDQDSEFSCSAEIDNNFIDPFHPSLCADLLTWDYAPLRVNSSSDWLTFNEQDVYATRAFESVIGAKTDELELTQECSSSLIRLFCGDIFPICRGNENVRPYGVCVSECEDMKISCESVEVIQEFDCKQGGRLNDPDKCFVVPLRGYFHLHEENGPYDEIPLIFKIVLFIWISLLYIWIENMKKHFDHCSLLARALTIMPIVKIIILMVALIFWGSCVAWGMCSLGLGIMWMNLNALFEALYFFCFLLISHGWSITHGSIRRSQWKTTIYLITIFYISNSILTISKPYIGGFFWIFLLALYGIVMFKIFENISSIITLLQMQRRTNIIDSTSSHTLANPASEKIIMYRNFFLSMFAFIVMECIIHGILMNNYKEIWISLLGHEIMELIIFFWIGFIFRPKEVDPMFYVIPENIPNHVISPLLTADASDTDFRGVESDEETDGSDSSSIKGIGSRIYRGYSQLKRNLGFSFALEDEALLATRTSVDHSLVVISNPGDDIAVGVRQISIPTTTTTTASILKRSDSE